MTDYEYTVKAGDTLSALSKKFYRDAKHYSALAKYNHIQNPDLINIGQKIKIPIYLTVSTGTKAGNPNANVVKASPPAAPAFPIVIAESANQPDHDRLRIADIADDMKYRDPTPGSKKNSGYDANKYGQIHQFCTADRAPNGLLFARDDELFEKLEEMAKSFSTGDLETNIIQMVAHFKDNTGTDYRSPILNRAAENHESMIEFVNAIKLSLTTELKHEPNHDITKISLLHIQERPIFNRTSDVVGGLKIAINDTSAFKVEALNYNFNATNNTYNAMLRITVYDHFGLDRPDLEENIWKLKVFAMFDGFRAWFILQHLRGYKPFITVVENQYEISDTL
jgi:LysM repeat protein